MADPLPPLETGPVEEIPSALLESDATWARRFGGNDTNLAERRRHNQDISAYTAALLREREAHQAQELQNNTKAQNFYFKSLELDRKKTNDAAVLAERDQRMRFANELHPLALEAKQAQTSASLARERATVQGAALKAKLDALQEDHTIGLQTHIDQLLSQGDAPGTKNFALGALRGAALFPSANSELKREILGLAKVKDEALNAYDALPEDQRGNLIPVPMADGSYSFRVKAAPAPIGKETITTINPDKTEKKTVTRPITETPAATPVEPAPSRAALAQKALDDPNATEAHKAAARRILGL